MAVQVSTWRRLNRALHILSIHLPGSWTDSVGPSGRGPSVHQSGPSKLKLSDLSNVSGCMGGKPQSFGAGFFLTNCQLFRPEFSWKVLVAPRNECSCWQLVWAQAPIRNGPQSGLEIGQSNSSPVISLVQSDWISRW